MPELALMLISLIKEWVNGKQKIQQAKQDREAAAIETQTKMIRDEESNNSAWEIANLADKDKWLRRISFAIFSFPVLWAVISPDGVARYFKVAMAAMPDWYIQTYIAINGVIWGVASLKNVAPAMIKGVRTAWKNWKDPDFDNK